MRNSKSEKKSEDKPLRETVISWAGTSEMVTDKAFQKEFKDIDRSLSAGKSINHEVVIQHFYEVFSGPSAAVKLNQKLPHFLPFRHQGDRPFHILCFVLVNFKGNSLLKTPDHLIRACQAVYKSSIEKINKKKTRLAF